MKCINCGRPAMPIRWAGDAKGKLRQWKRTGKWPGDSFTCSAACSHAIEWMRHKMPKIPKV